MTANAHRLARLQRDWLSAFTAPGGLRQGLARTPQFDAATVFVSPPRGTLAERLRVYTDGYWERLLECLRTEFGGLHVLLGDELFTFFARAYLRERPPQSRTLHDLGAAFPAFLLHTQRRMRAGDEQRRRQLVFAVELARLERAAAEIAYAQGLETSARDARISSAMPLGSPDALVAVPPTTRAFAMHHGLDAFARFFEPGCETNGDAEPATTRDAPPAFIVVWRHRYRIERRELQPWQFFALRACARGPRPLMACAAWVGRRTGERAGVELARLWLWLPIAHDASLLRLR